MTEQITVSVDSDVANLYRSASVKDRRKLDLLVNLRLRGSLDNLFGDCVTVVDRATCFFNVGPTPLHVFTQEGEHRVVVEPSILRMLEERRRHGFPG